MTRRDFLMKSSLAVLFLPFIKFWDWIVGSGYDFTYIGGMSGVVYGNENSNPIYNGDIIRYDYKSGVITVWDGKRVNNESKEVT